MLEGSDLWDKTTASVSALNLNSNLHMSCMYHARFVGKLIRIKNARFYHCKTVENERYQASVTFWNQCDYFPVDFISSCCFHVKLIVRACAGGSQYKSHSCQPLYFFSVVKSNHQRLALANVDGWMDGFFLAYCSRNQSQTNDIKLQMASLLVSIYGQRQTHINAIHNCTDVNAKQMCRNLEGSRQLALRKHSETYDWERLLFLHY